MKRPTGQAIIDAVIRAGAILTIERVADDRCIIIWHANAAEQIEAALAEGEAQEQPPCDNHHVAPGCQSFPDGRGNYIERRQGSWINWIGRYRGKFFHIGWHRQGNCWRFRYTKQRYSTCTFYSFWRLFVSIDKQPSQ